MDLRLSEEDFVYFQRVAHYLAGIHLTPAKRVLIETRLGPQLRRAGFETFSDYRRYLRSLPPSHGEWQELVNLLTTNKTNFFREPAHYGHLVETVIKPWLTKKPMRPFRLWSAASSTGEEPYTLAMILTEALGNHPFEILATDIDTKVLAVARNGVYRRAALEDVPAPHRDRHFAKGTGELADWVKIKSPLRDKVRFEQLNLAGERYPWQNEFDVIFCRNVLIYFDQETIARIAENLHRALRPGGVVYTGLSESLPHDDQAWRYAPPSAYTKRDSKAARGADRPQGAAPSSAITASPKDALLPPQPKKKVYIVDDSPTVCQLLHHVLKADERLEVIGVSQDPRQALRDIPILKPDVITLDIEMPHLDGVEVLRQLMPTRPTPVVLISALSRAEGSKVFAALELGAIDYIEKPSLTKLTELAPHIQEKVHTAALAHPRTGRTVAPPRGPALARNLTAARREVIAIGASTGGTEALREVLTALPAEIPPILIVQHIPPVFSATFADRMNGLCPFLVKEAVDGDEVRPNQVLIAPGGQQMSLVRRGVTLAVRISDDPPVNRHKPSVDVLFHAVASLLGPKAVGAILTGMGADGARGLLAMRQAGARTLAQDEATSVVYGMPREAAICGAAEVVAPLGEIGSALLELFASDPAKKSA